MKYLPAFFLAVFVCLSCNDKAGTALSAGRALRYWFDKTDTLPEVWKLVRSFDPYDGGKLSVFDSANTRYLVIANDGSFREYDAYNVSEGSWRVNKSNDHLSLTYEKQNGFDIPINRRDTLFRYEIRRHDDDTLVLAIQGRHGMVAQTFAAVLSDSTASSSR
jgi:hypothetical protein